MMKLEIMLYLVIACWCLTYIWLKADEYAGNNNLKWTRRGSISKYVFLLVSCILIIFVLFKHVGLF